MNRRDVIIGSVKLIGLGLLAPTLAKASEQFFDFAPEFDRSSTLVETLEAAAGKPYADITPDDLAKITTLNLEHIHIESFNSNDFAGLAALSSLTISSIFHRKSGIVGKETFEPLERLETLVLSFNQFDAKLSPDVFAPLKALKTLDLRNNIFALFPESVFTAIPRLETLKVSRNLSKPILDRLQEQFGGRLVVQ